MFVISPTSNVGSPQKRDRFLALLKDVATVTNATEPQCLAYAWFRNACDSDVVPHHWVKGLEVYEVLEASTQTHRSSLAYKVFRATCASESLLDRGSDLRYMEPLDIGFMMRPGSSITLQGRSSDAYVVFETLKVKDGRREELLQVIRGLAEEAERLRDIVESWWVLGYRAEDNDPIIILFERFPSKKAYEESFAGSSVIQTYRGKVADLCEIQMLTTWIDAGIGFIGRA